MTDDTPNPVSPTSDDPYQGTINRTRPAPVQSPVVVDLQPPVALGALALLSLIATIVSDNHLGWFLTAVAFAYGAWFVRQRGVQWPNDVQSLLAAVRLGPRPGTRHSRDPDATGTRSEDRPSRSLIPLRPLTFPELFTSAAKVVVRNWPSLIGIPVLVCIGFFVVLLMVLAAALAAVTTVPSEVVGGFMLSTISSPAAFLASIVATVLVIALIGLPADALLIGLSVTATDRAVRGEPVRLSALVSHTARRLFAICRLTGLYYLLSFAPPLLFWVIVVATGFEGVAVAAVVMLPIYVALFIAGIMFSLAPVVMIVEERGAIDSFRRAAQLARPAFGRLFAIHALWVAGILGLSIPAGILGMLGLPSVFYLILLGGLVAMFRALQMLIYIDLRMRQENYTPDLG